MTMYTYTFIHTHVPVCVMPLSPCYLLRQHWNVSEITLSKLWFTYEYENSFIIDKHEAICKNLGSNQKISQSNHSLHALEY